ncbi:hypothetical protein FGK63_07815 [Ruegeria sediminis]|uniref:Phosphoadenosine phosphosulfate reductase n=1 Tax=Ruegeria sediminis TaxID=2583820 RepID=A0ABY2X2A4_9RHOB|nr:hypothetical protein [Ruegeria sediminis]TMV09018.1 hypothetical protein FGK63_07815 [Ruegeria sediminis]
MTEELSKSQLKPDHPDRTTGYERILTDPAPPWFVELYPGGDGKGFLQKLERHAISFHHRSEERLVVSFDNIAVVNDLSFAREPWGWKFFRDRNWSHLGVFARTKAWFRDEEIITYLEGKAREGFFDRFGQVVLTGSSMGAFAALAFARLVPGATVVAFNPQSTLDERLVPWETRYRYGRIQNWDLPYGDCAESLPSIGRLYLFYDPFFDLDHKHAQRLMGPNTTILKTWFSNHFSAPMLRKLGLLKPLMNGAMDGTLTEAQFYQMFRARRTLPWYMRGLEERGAETHAQLVQAARRKFKTLRRESRRNAEPQDDADGLDA